MEKCGARARPGSGNQEGRPEDGATKHHFLLQSKRTGSAKQVTLKVQDFKDLSFHAGIEGRLPILVATMEQETIVCIRLIHIPELLKRARETNCFSGDFYVGGSLS